MKRSAIQCSPPISTASIFIVYAGSGPGAAANSPAAFQNWLGHSVAALKQREISVDWMSYKDGDANHAQDYRNHFIDSSWYA